MKEILPQHQIQRVPEQSMDLPDGVVLVGDVVRELMEQVLSKSAYTDFGTDLPRGGGSIPVGEIIPELVKRIPNFQMNN